MAVTIPTVVPKTFTAGETVKFNITDPDYPASAGTLSFFWTNADDAFGDTTSTADGDTFNIVVTAALSGAITAGTYSYQGRYTSNVGSEETIIRAGTTVVNPEFTTAQFDNRTTAKKMLDAIDATILLLTAQTNVAMSIQGRSQQSQALSEAFATRDKLKAEVRAEQVAESIANGMGNPNVIRTRF